MKNSFRDLGVTVLALGTTFGLGIITGISASAYVVFKAYIELHKELNNRSHKDDDQGEWMI